MTRVPGTLLMLVALGGLTAACGSPAPPPPTPLPQPTATAAPTAVAPAARAEPQPAAETAAEPPKVTYDSKGRRDPFETGQREGTTAPNMIASAKLTGIVRSASGTLALIETPDGLGYILRPGDTLGEGRLVEINRNNVVFSLPPRPGATTNRVVLTLPSE